MSSHLSNSKSETSAFRPSTLARTDSSRRPPSRRSARSQRQVPPLRKAALILTAFLPIPVVVSAVYAAIGHAILGAAHHNLPPLAASVRAAAAGGVILALPLAILIYLLLFPTTPPQPDDFIDYDESSSEPWWTYAAYGFLGVLGLTLGAISTALGTVCLSSRVLHQLTAAEAAEVGIVGGAVVYGALAFLAFVAFAIWHDCIRPKSDNSEVL